MSYSTARDFVQVPFDYIIVGGGTAGLVVAARLSEDTGIQVGVIEAGLSRLGDPKVDLPTGPGLMMNNPDYDWNYRSVPQESAGGRIYHIPRGKMLGGSSGINFMAYGRPCAADIDDWSDTFGLKGWTWAELMPYFLKSEKLEIDQPDTKSRRMVDYPIVDATHGLSGPIHTSRTTWQIPFEEAVIGACDGTSGFGRPLDPYSGSHVGFYRSLFTTERTAKPTRSYAASGYLSPILGRRPNLWVLTDALATKVILECPEDGVPIVRGVEFLAEGTKHSVSTRREVILSAGTLQSPQLLELSGIGDKKILDRAKVPCLVHNSSVGNNLQEHVMSAVVYELAPGLMSLDSLLADSAILKEHQMLFAESYSGALSGAVSLTGFVPYSACVSRQETEVTNGSISHTVFATGGSSLDDQTSNQRKQQEAIVARMRRQDSADLQFIGSPANFDIGNGQSNCSKLMTGAPAGYNACYSITVSNMYPLSRGSVHLQSSCPEDAPLIDPRFLSHPADVDILAAGVEFADRIFRSPLLDDKIKRRVSPAADVNLSNKQEAHAFVRDHIVSYHHALGTCAMGQVVDDRLRVKGVKGLRVVDASVLPMQVSTAIMATVYAVAEKGADIVKQDWRKEQR